MKAKVKQKKVSRKPRTDVPADERAEWMRVRSVIGAEKMYAQLLVNAGVGQTTSRNAIEGGSATSEVVKKITNWCKKQKV